MQLRGRRLLPAAAVSQLLGGRQRGAAQQVDRVALVALPVLRLLTPARVPLHVGQVGLDLFDERADRRVEGVGLVNAIQLIFAAAAGTSAACTSRPSSGTMRLLRSAA